MPVFDVWSKVEDSILKAPHLILMLDYDGTLTPIRERPEHASLPRETKRLLKNISLLSTCTLCIVSGRTLEEIKKLVKLKNIIYVGNHGLEASGKGMEYLNPNAAKTTKIIRKIHQELLQETKNISGILLEYKHLTEALHYRMVSESRVKEVRAVFNRVTAPYVKSGAVKTAENKKTLEVLPNVEWDKGKIVQYIISHLSMKLNSFLPIYIGDDATDEHAFKALKKSGITILVSEHPKASHAQYRLKDIEEVIKFLELLYTLISAVEKRRKTKIKNRNIVNSCGSEQKGI